MNNMRKAKENDQWRGLNAPHKGRDSRIIQVGGHSLDISNKGTFFCGRNGSGKSQALREIKRQLESEAVLLDLHSLCHSTLDILRSRDDIAYMIEELSPAPIPRETKNDIERIVGREYDEILWYALELSPTEEGGPFSAALPALEESLVPYFLVTHKGHQYDSSSMGLGELAVHILYWSLLQVKDFPSLVCILDEPDAYLTPEASTALFSRLLALGRKEEHKWSLVFSSHSNEAIVRANDAQVLYVSKLDADGEFSITRSADSMLTVHNILSPPATRYVVYVEDHAALHLAKALLNSSDRYLARQVELIPVGGSGPLDGIGEKLDLQWQKFIKHAVLYDGDQRTRLEKMSKSKKKLKHIFLPTHSDPDNLFKTIKGLPELLVEKLASTPETVSDALDNVSGFDPHDWTNELGETFGKERFLDTVAQLWVSQNENEARDFTRQFRNAMRS